MVVQKKKQMKETTPLVGAAAPRRCCWVTYSSREVGLYVTLVLIGALSSLRSGLFSAVVPAAQPQFSHRGYSDPVTLWPGLMSTCQAIGKLAQILVVDHFGVYWTACVGSALMTLGAFMVVSGVNELMAVGITIGALANAQMWGVGIRCLANWVPGETMGSAVGLALSAANDGSPMVFGVVVAGLQAAMQPMGSWGATFAPFLMIGTLLLLNTGCMFLLLRGSAVEAGFEPPTAPPARKRRKDDGHAEEQSDAAGKGAAGKGAAGKGAAGDDAVHPLDILTVREALLVFASERCVHLGVGLSVFFALFNCISSYLATFGVAVGFDAASASMLVTVSALGTLLGDVGAGLATDRLSPIAFYRCGLCSQLLAAAAMSAILVLWCSGTPSHLEALRAVLPAALAIINLPAGIYWSVFVTVFAVRFGGPKHASTLCGLMDFISYVCVIPAQFAFGSLVEAGSWTPVLAWTAAFLFLALVATNLLLHYEDRLPALPTLGARVADRDEQARVSV